ncbi:MAG TPA: hypothetical protein DCY63_07225, partial [Acidimicrobiaceae bacterium]|nr:hypothetical protein [Acidimicrobiaceae bacterium]
KITYIWSTFEEEYERVHNEFLKGPFAKEQVDLLLDAWEQQISPVVKEAAEIHDDALRFEDWQEALDGFRRSLGHARSIK